MLILIPCVLVSRFEGELLMCVTPFYDCHHFFNFALLDIQHAKSGCVELETEEIVA